MAATSETQQGSSRTLIFTAWEPWGDTAPFTKGLQYKPNDSLLRVSLESGRRASLEPWLFPGLHFAVQFSSVAQ